jgi:serine/threonine-protein kinase RsbW
MTAFDLDGHAPASEPATASVRVHLACRLPRQAVTVTMARQILQSTLALIGAADDCRDDIVLALTEACANAVLHADGDDGYQVTVTVGGDHCIVEVADGGVGLDQRRLEDAESDLLWTSRRGYGLRIIRACADGLELRPAHPHGLVIRMTKQLTWKAGAPTA